MATVSAEQKPKITAPPEPKLQMSLIAIAGVCLVALAPLLYAHTQQLWIRPHYQFFPLVLVGAAVLAWSRRAELQFVLPGSGAVTIGLLAFTWVLLAGAELVNSSWLAAVTALFLVLTVMQALGLVRRFFLVWIYLWLLIPPPFGLDNSLIMKLQTLTTNWSSSLLDLVGVQHAITGHIIEVGGQRLFVEEACAGINSLFSILACALFYIFLMRIHVIRATLLLLASIGWVLVANMARVFIIAYTKPWDLNLTDGWRHEALGFLLFAVALVLIVSTHRLLLFFTPFSNTQADIPHDEVELSHVPEVISWATVLNQSTLNSWFVGGAFGFLLVVHLAAYGVPRGFVNSPGVPGQNVLTLNEETMPRDLEGLRREKWGEDQRSVSNAFGEFSKTWTYQGEGGLRSVVSLDYPFPAWHELSQCYNGNGWKLGEITNHRTDEPGQPAHFCEQKMTKPGLRSGYLLYCQIDSTGQVLTPPERGFTATIHRQQSILTRLLNLDNPKADAVQAIGSVYQFQFFTESYTPLTKDDERRMQARFFKAYSEIKGPLFKGAVANP